MRRDRGGRRRHAGQARRGRRRLLQSDVAGDHDDRHAALADGRADRELEHARHLRGTGDRLAIVAAILGTASPDAFPGNRRCPISPAWDLRGDGEHRYAGAMAVEQAVDEMQVAGPATSGADREATGEVRLGAGREGGDLLVADVHPFDVACLRIASVRPFRLSPTMP